MKRNKKLPEDSLDFQQNILCSNLSFAGSEAYKLLRTNILFSFSDDDQKCKVIGVTSSERGEGKSVTSVNLAYSLAQMGKTVLLLEADLRLPNVAKRMNLKVEPGLSDLLVGRASGNDVLQHVEKFKNFFVISAGKVPPNPAELLGSRRMEQCVAAFTDSFEYVIVDLPPINIVSDALALTKLVSGYVFVVRQDFSTRQSVTEAIAKMHNVDAKLLGFVMTSVPAPGKGGRYSRSKYYSKNYRYSYGYGRRSRGEAKLAKGEETVAKPDLNV